MKGGMDIKSYRTDLGLTQEELAEKLGVTQSTVSRWETGELEINIRTTLSLDALRMQLKAKAA
jgi:transcriptional regulator with XRE-family HTH domain